MMNRTVVKFNRWTFAFIFNRLFICLTWLASTLLSMKYCNHSFINNYSHLIKPFCISEFGFFMQYQPASAVAKISKWKWFCVRCRLPIAIISFSTAIMFLSDGNQRRVWIRTSKLMISLLMKMKQNCTDRGNCRNQNRMRRTKLKWTRDKIDIICLDNYLEQILTA